MALPDTIRLLVLSIIWGASFMLMRIAAPEFGPVVLIAIRTLLAAACFAIVFRPAEHRACFRRHIGGLAVVGLISTAIPFSLLAYATLSLEAGFTSLLNATTPLFAAFIGAVWFATPLKRHQLIGIAIAILGIAVLSWGSLSFKPGGSGWAVVAALVASAGYGLGANFTKRRLAGVPSNVVSAGALLIAGVVMLPLGIGLWPDTQPSAKAWICAIVLAVVCTAAAYFIFFNLLTRIGAMPATTVTFLIPVFAIAWGAAVLGESVDAQLVAGMLVTLAGTAIAVGLLVPRRREPRATES